MRGLTYLAFLDDLQIREGYPFLQGFALSSVPFYLEILVLELEILNLEGKTMEEAVE